MVSEQAQLRVAAVWGTTVLDVRTLEIGESFLVGDEEGAYFPIPDGITMSTLPIRGGASGWEVDAKGALGGMLRVRGREEDPLTVARSGMPLPVVPGDYGLLQYGLFSLFFQFTKGPAVSRTAWLPSPELLASLALVTSAVAHLGLFGLFRALMTPPPMAKPLELTDPEALAAAFHLNREVPEEPKPETGDKAGGVKDPGLKDPKKQGGGKKAEGTEGKTGTKGPADKAEMTGEIKPAKALGGISEVLSGETGQQIRSSLQSISSVTDALGGLNSQTITLGGGPGMGLHGKGGGGGGVGLGTPFGAGNLATGGGPGSGGGYGNGVGGPGGKGSGGGNGSGVGTGSGGGESKVVGVGTGSAKGGLSPEQINRVVMAHTGALRACYESEAQKNPNLRGGMTIAWQIDPSGSVSTANVAGSSLSNPRVEGCVVRQVKTWHFPTNDTNTQVSYPFKFGVGG